MNYRKLSSCALPQSLVILNSVLAEMLWGFHVASGYEAEM